MKTKKLLALVLAVIMTLALGTTAFAANDGSISIANSVKDQTYKVYKVFDLTYTEGSVAYTYTKTGTNDALFTALNGTNSPFTLAQVGNSSLYNVALKDGADEAAISSFFTGLINANPAVIAPVKNGTGNGGELEFSGLAYGYYFIKSSLGTVLTIDSTKPNAEVIDKNQDGPDWDNGTDKPGKVIVEGNNKVTQNDAAFGDVVNFDIGVNTTNYKGEKKIINYFVSDTIGSGFTYDKTSIAVQVGSTPVTNYSITWGEDGQSFEITIPWVDENGDALYPATAELHVTYSATVDNDAVIAGEGNPNTANYTYQTATPGTDPETPDTPDEKKPYEDTNKKTTTTYVYALGIQKVDENGDPLANAEFTIGGVKANATDVAGVYEYAANGTVTTFVTNEDGQIIIKGVDSGTYTVTETKAPDGYNLLTAPVSVVANASGVDTYVEEYTVYYDADGNIVDEAVTGGSTGHYDFDVNVVDLVVVNHSGTELPSTGGIGTTIFYIAGSLLVLAAGILLITKKRMGAEG